MSLFNKLFIEGVRYEKERVTDDNIYPFNIPAIKSATLEILPSL